MKSSTPKGKKHDWRADITAALAKRQQDERQLEQRAAITGWKAIRTSSPATR